MCIGNECLLVFGVFDACHFEGVILYVIIYY